MLKKYYSQIKYILRGGVWILLLYRLCSKECKQLIEEDIAAYSRKNSEKLSLLGLVYNESKKPFRNVLYFRFRKDNCNEKILKICRFFVRPLSTIEIGGEIAGGLKIIHNYCVISVNKAGRNFTVLQGVTIGKNIDGGLPTIGDNVIIYPNAVVFGKINIGNGVMIGAGSLINKDVPENVAAVGNPFRIVPKH